MKINIAVRKHIAGLTFWVNAERSKHECTTWNTVLPVSWLHWKENTHGCSSFLLNKKIKINVLVKTL
jgi:hypothetical protein